MPVQFLSAHQRATYGRYTGVPSQNELARDFHVDEADLERIFSKRAFIIVWGLRFNSRPCVTWGDSQMISLLSRTKSSLLSQVRSKLLSLLIGCSLFTAKGGVACIIVKRFAPFMDTDNGMNRQWGCGLFAGFMVNAGLAMTDRCCCLSGRLCGCSLIRSCCPESLYS